MFFLTKNKYIIYANNTLRNTSTLFVVVKSFSLVFVFFFKTLICIVYLLCVLYSLSTKALVIANVVALSAGSVSFGSIIGEELANRIFKDKNNFIQLANISNNINLELFL